MKRAQWTDLFREIKKSKGRYISLIFIVALGTAFFTGVRSAEPDMIASADKYYDESNFMDVRVLGTLGLTGEDVETIADTEGIEKAEGGYSTEVFTVADDEEMTVNVMSSCETLNQMTVWEGRMPEAENECFMDAGFMIYKGYELGDTITVTNEEGESPESLKTDTFKIVGSGTWAWYLSWSRGAASIGDGSLDAFMVVPEETFDMDYYTVIYAMVNGVKHMNTFSKTYDEAVELVTKRIEEVAGERCDIRYTEVYEDAEKALADAKKEISDGEEKLADAEKQLQDGEKAYAAGKKAYEDGKRTYANGKRALESGKQELNAAKQTLDAGKKAYKKGVRDLEKSEAALKSGQQTLKNEKKKLEENEKKVSQGEKDCEDAEKLITQAEKELEKSEAELKPKEAEYKEKLSSYQAKEEKLQQVKAQLDAGWRKVDAAQNELDEIRKEMNQVEEQEGKDSEKYQQLQTKWSQKNEQLQEQKKEMKQQQAEYDEAAAELRAVKTRLDQAKVQVEEARGQVEAGKAELQKQKNTLAKTKTQITEAKKKIEEGHKTIAKSEKELEAGEVTLESSKKQLEAAKKEVETGESDYNKGLQKIQNSEAQLKKAERELEAAQQKLLKSRQELEEGWKEYKEASKKADAELEEARQEISKGEKELAELEKGKWYVLGRDTVQTSVEYSLDAKRIGAIGKVLPVIFFLVAALVSLTTMTRMIEEERTLIGTMKALGYSKLSIASKYILYALSATLVGGGIGVVIGSKVLPMVIMKAYSMIYSNVQYMLRPLHLGLCVSSIGLAVLCTVGAAFLACYKELLSTPAALMRPPAPKQGKRVFMENFPFIWKRLNFSMKATIRNLVRYKKRFFMTIFGIGGCMALLLVSFGLRDSISVIADNQYKNIWTYSASCGIEEGRTLEEKQDKVKDILADKPEIKAGMLVRQVRLDVSTKKSEKTADLYVVEDTQKMKSYLDLHDRVSKESYELTDDGVILTEKLSNILGVTVGDSITLKLSDTKRKDVTVAAIAENYYNHYIYMTPALYEKLYDKEPEYNQLFLNFKEKTDVEKQQELAKYLLSQDMMKSVSLVKELQDSMNDMMNALNLVVWVLIISAGLLVFVVLFNLNNINISERRRELASLKVLGFYEKEVAMYVYRENVFLTFVGIILGVFLGIWLHKYLILTIEVDMIMFGRQISMLSYLYSILFTIIFAVFVNFCMFRKLKQIDMVESLKSVE